MRELPLKPWVSPLVDKSSVGSCLPARSSPHAGLCVIASSAATTSARSACRSNSPPEPQGQGIPSKLFICPSGPLYSGHHKPTTTSAMPSTPTT